MFATCLVEITLVLILDFQPVTEVKISFQQL